MNKTTLLTIFGALGGRKLIVTLLTMFLAAPLASFLPGDQVTAFIGMVATGITYIIGQSVADAASKGATSTTAKITGS